MISREQTKTSLNGETPSVAFFIWRLLRYRPTLRLARSIMDIMQLSGPLIDMLLVRAFFDSLQKPLQANILNGFSQGNIVAVYLVAGLTITGMRLLRTATGNSLGFWVVGLLRRNLLAHILARPGIQALTGSMGEVLSTIRDDADQLEGMNGLPLDILTQMTYFASGLAILLWIDIQVTLLVFIPSFIVWTLSHIGRGQMQRLRSENRKVTARYRGSMGEALTAVQAVQVAGAEESVVNHLCQLGKKRQHAALLDWLQSWSWGTLYSLSSTIGTGLVLLTSAGKMRSGAFTVGDFTLFVNYLSDIGEFLTFGVNTLIEYRLTQVSVDRLVALLQGSDNQIPPEYLVEYHPLWLREEPLPIPKSVKTKADRLQMLQVRGLSFSHAESGTGIQDISFTAHRGTLTVIVGRIGSGKTTLLRVLLGQLPMDKGEVLWNGECVDDLAAFCIPPRVAYTPQVPVLLSDTLRENILLGVPAEAYQLEHAVHHAVLEQDLATFPDGLDTMIGVRGMKLSGGQIQRTAAARMFIREPELLVMDDISSALDVETEQVFWQRIFENPQRTCLVVSHRRAVLERADQILVMENGSIKASGTLAELLQTSDEMRKLYVDQNQA